MTDELIKEIREHINRLDDREDAWTLGETGAEENDDPRTPGGIIKYYRLMAESAQQSFDIALQERDQASAELSAIKAECKEALGETLNTKMIYTGAIEESLAECGLDRLEPLRAKLTALHDKLSKE